MILNTEKIRPSGTFYIHTTRISGDVFYIKMFSDPDYKNLISEAVDFA